MEITAEHVSCRREFKLDVTTYCCLFSCPLFFRL